MGYMRHHAIVVTSWNDSAIEEIHTFAECVFPWVSPISPEAINGYRSFFIPPDGSKEGWPESHKGDERRQIFIHFIREGYDRGVYADYVEVQFGDDGMEARVVNSVDDDEKVRYDRDEEDDEDDC